MGIRRGPSQVMCRFLAERTRACLAWDRPAGPTGNGILYCVSPLVAEPSMWSGSCAGKAAEMAWKNQSVAVRERSLRDARVICDCQRHRGRRMLAVSAIRTAHYLRDHLHRGGVALLVGVPLAFGALGFPIEAMNLSLPVLRQRAEVVSMRTLPVFTTPAVRNTFLDPEAAKARSLEIVKEDFFRTSIPYGSIIYREARRNGLPPELVAAVIESESDFRPLLISNKQARGLMQIIPETGRMMGCKNLFNPDQNVAAGTRYLRYLFDRFGDQKIVLAAYNAGEGNVERFGGVPPFTETRDYLQRVSSRTHSYRQRVRYRYMASVRMRPALTE